MTIELLWSRGGEINKIRPLGTSPIVFIASGSLFTSVLGFLKWNLVKKKLNHFKTSTYSDILLLYSATHTLLLVLHLPTAREFVTSHFLSNPLLERFGMPSRCRERLVFPPGFPPSAS